jgi:hypothetical protein
MAVQIPTNYFAVPSEIGVYGAIFDLPNDTRSLRQLPTIPATLSPISGITNLSLAFNVNTGTFRGIGDTVQVRKPVSWETTLEMTRFITDRHQSLVSSIFKEMNRFSSNTGGFLFGSNLLARYVMVVRIDIPNDLRNKVLRLRFIGSFTNVSISGDRGKVEETISLQGYINGAISAAFV